MHPTTDPWSAERKLQALERGPHQSAFAHAEFVREEFADFVHKRFSHEFGVGERRLVGSTLQGLQRAFCRPRVCSRMHSYTLQSTLVQQGSCWMGNVVDIGRYVAGSSHGL